MKKAQHTLRELEQTLERLTPFENLAKAHASHVEVKAQNGTIFMFGLLKNETIAVADVYITKDTSMSRHSHPEDEFFLLYQGRMDLTINGKKKILRTSECAHMPSNQPHSAFWPEETRLIAVTIPGSKDFPDASR